MTRKRVSEKQVEFALELFNTAIPDTDTLPFARCKICGDLIEQSIEGELVCTACWVEGQMTEEEREIERRLTEAQKPAVWECPICHKHEVHGFNWERGERPCDRCMYEVFGEIPF